jgi:hypothetical protein
LCGHYQSFLSIINQKTNRYAKQKSIETIQCVEVFLNRPVLAAFLFYFQVKVIAQEKDSPIVAAIGAMAGPPNIVINKNTTDAELKAHSQLMKEKYSAKLKFSKVKRNSAGEITGIKADYGDKDGHKATLSLPVTNRSSPSVSTAKTTVVWPLAIRKNNCAFSLKAGYSSPDPAEPAAPVDPEDAEATVYAYSFEVPEAPEAPELPELEALDDMINVGDVNVVVKTVGKDGKMKIIVNGEEMNIDTDKILADIDLEKIQDQARKSVIIAKKQIEAARPQMERQKACRRSAQQLRRSREEMEQAREEMEQSRRELEEARRNLKSQDRNLNAKGKIGSKKAAKK